jgi:cyanophycinase
MLLHAAALAACMPATLASGDRTGLGVDEDTALVVRGSVAEVAGRSGVVPIDLRSATVQAAQPLALRDARISYLGSGDQVVLASGAVTVTAERLGGITLDHTAPDFAPEYSEPRFFWDMLGHRALTDLLSNLMESKQASARGVALIALAMARRWAMSSASARSPAPSATCTPAMAAMSTRC